MKHSPELCMLQHVGGNQESDRTFSGLHIAEKRCEHVDGWRWLVCVSQSRQSLAHVITVTGRQLPRVIMILDMVLSKLVEILHHIPDLTIICPLYRHIRKWYGGCGHFGFPVHILPFLIGFETSYVFIAISVCSSLGRPLASNAQPNNSENHKQASNSTACSNPCFRSSCQAVFLHMKNYRNRTLRSSGRGVARLDWTRDDITSVSSEFSISQRFDLRTDRYGSS